MNETNAEQVLVFWPCPLHSDVRSTTKTIKVTPFGHEGVTAAQLYKYQGTGKRIWGRWGGLGGAHVVLDLADDGAAEGVEISVILEAPHHLRSSRLPPPAEAAEVGHGDGERGAVAPNF